jgi:Cu/Ag efflux protein CusF
MKRLVVFVLIGVMLALTGASSFAAMKHHKKQVAIAPIEYKGEVTQIKGSILTVKDEEGKTHNVRVTDPKALEGIKVGDKVDIKLEKGKPVSVQKM